MDAPVTTIVLVLFYILPLLHVAMSDSAGPWRAPQGPNGRTTCPFSPRVGWVVIVLLLGPVGWLLFVFRRRARTPRIS